MGITVLPVRVPLNVNNAAPPTLLPQPPKVESDHDSMSALSPLMLPSSPCPRAASPLPPVSLSPQPPAQLEATVERVSSLQQSKTKTIYRRRIETALLNKVLQLEKRRLAVEERTMRAVERLVEDLAAMRAEIKAATETRQLDRDTSVRRDEERQKNESRNNLLPGIVTKPVANNVQHLNKTISQKRDRFKISDEIKTWPRSDLDNDTTKDKDEFDFFGCSMTMQLKKLPELDALRLMQKMLCMVTDIKRKHKEENNQKELDHSRYIQRKRPTQTSSPELSSESMTDLFVQDTEVQELDLSEQDTKQKLFAEQ